MVALAAPNVATAKGPSPSKIRAALRKAERSNELWATINICKTSHHQGQLGIRGQMPSLSFAADMYMTFEVTYQTSTDSGFKPLPATKARLHLGQAANKVLQLGRTYPFQTSRTLLAGRITFEWRRQGKVLGRVTRKTTGGHHHVAFANPPGYSAATCKLG